MTLPAYLDTHTAIVDSSGAGKTVTGKGQVEQLLADKRHVVILDPTGVWWGLQSSADNSGPGFPLPIFGGQYATAPIGPTDGAAVAGLVVDQRRSAIVDLSEIHSADAQRVFMAAFVARMRAKPIGNLHLVVDEADEACPQTAPDGEGYRLLQDMIWIAKRGRVRGFVLTAITQRPADISKAVLSQMQTIIAHQLVAPQDQSAIDAYLKANGDKETRARVMASLPELARGERWIYSPRLKLLERAVTPPIATFDSSSTPGAGDERAAPRAWEAGDAQAVRDALSAARPAATPLDPMAAFNAGTAAGEALLELRAEIVRLEQRVEELVRECDRWCARAAQAAELLTPPFEDDSQADVEPSCETPVPATPVPPADRPITTGVVIARSSTLALGPERRPLAVLAGVAPAGLSEPAWATLAGFKRTGGTWGTYKSRLRTAGAIEKRGELWHATDVGVAGAGSDVARPPPPGAALVDYWAERVPGAGRMLRYLGKIYPRGLTRDALAAELGMAVGGGTFSTYLSRLRTNGLVEGLGKRIRLAPALMIDDA